MFVLFTLIFSSQVFAATDCAQVTLTGFLRQEKGKIFFVTHVRSQKEKLWPIEPKSYSQRLDLLARSGEILKIDGRLSQNKISILNYIADPALIENSRTAEAVIVSKSQCF